MNSSFKSTFFDLCFGFSCCHHLDSLVTEEWRKWCIRDRQKSPLQIWAWTSFSCWIFLYQHLCEGGWVEVGGCVCVRVRVDSAGMGTHSSFSVQDPWQNCKTDKMLQSHHPGGCHPVWKLPPRAIPVKLTYRKYLVFSPKKSTDNSQRVWQYTFKHRSYVELWFFHPLWSKCLRAFGALNLHPEGRHFPSVKLFLSSPRSCHPGFSSLILPSTFFFDMGSHSQGLHTIISQENNKIMMEFIVWHSILKRGGPIREVGSFTPSQVSRTTKLFDDVCMHISIGGLVFV